jgi:hypothetical protein
MPKKVVIAGTIGYMSSFIQKFIRGTEKYQYRISNDEE